MIHEHVCIREMVISDYDDVMNLWSASEGMSIREADSKENIERYLNHNIGLSYIALAYNQLIGAVLAGTDGRRGYVQHLAVNKEYRFKGIGKSLLNRVIESLNKQGVLKTHLFVHGDNMNAQKFYEHNGWFPRNEIKMFSYNSCNNIEI
jgi:N-acetylglutamate synthase